jgi:hypothetical protein
LIVQNDALRRGVDFHCAIGCSPSRDSRADDETATREVIFAPNSPISFPQTPWSHDPEERADIIVKARALVDADIAKKSD